MKKKYRNSYTELNKNNLITFSSTFRKKRLFCGINFKKITSFQLKFNKL